MTESQPPTLEEQEVVRLAEKAVERVASERRPFTITKFQRSPDGFLHARVTAAGGKPIYVHRKFGSWMAPGTFRGREVLKEVAQEVKVELQRKALALEKAERSQRGEPDAPDQRPAGDAAQGGRPSA